MDYTNEDVLEAARTIRPLLADLLEDEQQAQALDAQLARLLEQARAGEPVANRILDLLSKETATREWLRRFLKGEGQLTGKGFEPLPGPAAPVPAPKFVCPQGDYVWHRHSVGQPVPRCPTHNLPLVPARDAATGDTEE